MVWLFIELRLFNLFLEVHCVILFPVKAGKGGLSGKLAGASMRSKDLAKASGLAVAFDHTAPTFYRVSRKVGAQM